jgi:PPP family 3-phenylpropionic acid transporter
LSLLIEKGDFPLVLSSEKSRLLCSKNRTKSYKNCKVRKSQRVFCGFDLFGFAAMVHTYSMIPAYIFEFAAFGAITPFLPLLVRGLGYSPLFVGILLGIFEGAGIAGPFAFGFFADKSGNYKVPIITSYFITVCSVLPLVYFVHPALSIVFIVLFAFSFRASAPLLDAAATVLLGERGDYGKVRAMGSISFIVMVLFLQWTPVLKLDNAANIAFWMAVTTAAAIVPTLFLPNCKREKTAPEAGSGGRIWTPLFVGGFLIIFLCRLAMSSVYTFFPLYLTESMHWNVVGIMFALATAFEVPCMFISAALIRRYGPLPLLALAAAAISLRLGIYALFPIKLAIVGAQMLHAFCFGIFHPAAVAFISQSVPPEKRAIGMSLYLSLGSGLPSLLGNILGGFIVERSGYAPLFASFAGFTFIALIIYAILIYTKLTHV